jgi:hypothetical protein
MARRRTTPQRLPDAVRDAVERTIQTTLGGAQQTRGRAQEALDEVVHGAEAGAKTVRQRVRAAADAARPATVDDLKEMRAEIKRLSKRVEQLEAGSRPAARSPRKKTSAASKKPPAAGRGPRAKKS